MEHYTMTSKAFNSVSLVAEFHLAFGQEDATYPTAFNPTTNQLVELQDIAEQMKRTAERCLYMAKEYPKNKAFIRLHLIQEELQELATGFANNDVVEVLDALTDLQYVLDGTYLATALAPLKEGAFYEVQRSNMSKLGEDGKPVLNEAGRVLKGPNYSEPDLHGLVGAYLNELGPEPQPEPALEEQDPTDEAGDLPATSKEEAAA